MRFLSTRGRAPEIGFREAVLSGLAPDGGLYLPVEWPQISRDEQASFGRLSFADVAARILSRFAAPDLPERQLATMAERAYAPFVMPEVAPLRPIGDDDYLLELFHGPTLAFKDVAMRMLAELYDWALQGCGRGKTIIGATSGDTGGAAIAAFANKQAAEVFMLHPRGRVSDVQRRMMTTTGAANVTNLAIDGSFDDCQRVVKTLFANERLNRSHDLGGVNSINFIRLAIQTVYYFTARAALGRAATFVVPTGNFGDAFAGYAARPMGLADIHLAIAVNENDIMKRVLTTGAYEPSATIATTSPSMDIQVASNFERLLFEERGRDPEMVMDIMGRIDQRGRMKFSEKIGSFAAESANMEEVAQEMQTIYGERKILVDPHTAVGLAALKKLRKSGAVDGPAICLATAHPAKFPDAVEAACGVRPALPQRCGDLMEREERMFVAPADAAVIRSIIDAQSQFGERK